MFKSYLTSAFRHLTKNKAYTVLNAIGLSVGLACFTLIGLWVKDELSYDRFHTNADRIYRVGGIFTDESGKFDQAVTPPPLAQALVNDFPEVEDAVRLDRNDATVRFGDKQFIEDDILLTDPSFLRIFTFKLKAGDPRTALNDPYAIILSESMAKKYFGDDDPLGKLITLFRYDPDGQGKEYNVTGVIEDCPSNSQFHYNFLVSFKTLEVYDPEVVGEYGWYNNSYYTYLLLKSGKSPRQLQSKFPKFLEKYMGVHNKEWKISYAYFLQPLSDIHLQSHLRYEIRETSSVGYVVIFATIGMMVLLLASINYVNLSTAFSSNRFREVGMRKVMGAMKKQLVGQYLIESWLMALLSLALAFAWIELSRPLFESLTGKPVVGLYTLATMVILLGTATLVGLFSGLYPSLVLSSFSPVNILKGQLKTGTSGVWLRKSLVVIQYSITIILVSSILVVQLQLKFIQNKDLGFDASKLLLLGVNGSREVMNGYDAFANDLLTRYHVSGMTRSNTTLAGGLGNSVAVMEDATGKKVNATVYRIRVDHAYLDVYKMNLIAGRFFSKDISSDSTKGFIVNEATIKTYGYHDAADAVGKSFSFGGNEGTIIGVVKDFHYNSLQYKVEPTCMSLLHNSFSRITVRFSGGIQESMAIATDAWKKHFPNSVMDFEFAEDALNSQYRSELRFSKVFIVFSAISLAIAGLGLFALVSYTVESRTKEIGIRKVLGASVSGIFSMLSKEFLLLIVIASVIAVPVGYYFMKQWLLEFAYRIELTPAVFLLAGLLVLLIAWLTVSLRTIKAAMSNPIESLRTE